MGVLQLDGLLAGNNPNFVPLCTMCSIGDLQDKLDVNDKEDENLNEQDDDVGS